MGGIGKILRGRGCWGTEEQLVKGGLGTLNNTLSRGSCENPLHFKTGAQVIPLVSPQNFENRVVSIAT